MTPAWRTISSTDVDIFNGKIRLTANGEIYGNSLSTSTIEVSELVLSGETHGQVTIPAGQMSLTQSIPEGVGNYLVILTPSGDTRAQFYVNKLEDEFEVHLKDVLEWNVTFEYVIIETD